MNSDGMDQDQNTDQNQQQATPKQQVSERLRQANNVLVTVKSDPSVDELAATIGLTLMLNKLGKHTTAVFSGKVPSTLEFLKPDETIETNTDSLRDFIVSLDKSKADKLRYKVEENVVKIFITPYRTSITQDDLEFSQGDFNVDAVVALGVTQREELDNAITSHGRILHDATFITVTAGQDSSELGQINWQEQGASSLCEMLVSISEAFQGGLIDTQMATAFLTGIVAETQRFSNTKTTPKVMTMSAQLMAAGANQQLIANELEKAVEVKIGSDNSSDLPLGGDSSAPDSTTGEDGSLSISHSSEDIDKTSNDPAATAEEPAQGSSDGENNENSDTNTTDGSVPLDLPGLGGSTDPRPSLEQLPGVEESLQKDSSLLPGGISSSAGFTLPSLDEPAVDAGASLPQVPSLDEPTKVSEQIHIDTEGNLMKKEANRPKHKVINPLGEVDTTAAAVPPLPEPVVEAQVETLPGFAPPKPDGAPSPSLEQILAETSGTDTDSEAPSSGTSPEPAASDQLPPLPGLDLSPSPPLQDTTSLVDLEKSVNSPHLDSPDMTTPAPAPADEIPGADVNAARDAVVSALGQGGLDESALPPRTDLNALPFNAPPEPVSYDSYRLPDTPALNDHVSDVTGNVPDGSLGLPPLPGQTPPPPNPENDNQMPPPPVPPPLPQL